jgi:hypothetical protein
MHKNQILEQGKLFIVIGLQKCSIHWFTAGKGKTQVLQGYLHTGTGGFNDKI